MKHVRRIFSQRFLLITAVLFIACLLYSGARLYFGSAADFTLVDGLNQCAKDAQGDSALIACARQIIHAQLQTHSTAELMGEISYGSAPAPYMGCHSIAHIIGSETYKKTGNIESALARCTDGCFSGCLHGVIGEVVTEKIGPGNIGDEIAHLDVSQIKEIGAKYCEYPALCHGIGHILYMQTSDFKKASDVCSAIASGVDREGCIAGVFMQGTGGISDALVMGTSVPALSVAYPKDLAYPCDKMPLAYQHGCFAYLPKYQQIKLAGMGISDSEGKLNASKKICESFENPARSYCFEGIGRFARNLDPRVPANSSIPAGTTPFCESFSTTSDIKSCLLGEVNSLRGYQYDSRAYAICTHLSTRSLQDFCYTINFSYFAPGVSSEKACAASDSKDRCLSEFATYQKERDTLPNYQLGLYKVD